MRTLLVEIKFLKGKNVVLGIFIHGNLCMNRCCWEFFRLIRDRILIFTIAVLFGPGYRGRTQAAR